MLQARATASICDIKDVLHEWDSQYAPYKTQLRLDGKRLWDDCFLSDYELDSESQIEVILE